MNLRHGNMKVQEYRLTFNQLSRYAPHMVADSRAQMNKFLYGFVIFGENRVQKCDVTWRYEHL